MASIVKTLKKVLRDAHSGHRYVSDRAQHDKPEHWTPSLTGDCEDFALWCRDTLKKHGIEADLVECLTEDKERHLICSVDGWVLDNRFPYLVAKHELRYKWIKLGRNGMWYNIESVGDD